jgi:hypothetical protein
LFYYPEVLHGVLCPEAHNNGIKKQTKKGPSLISGSVDDAGTGDKSFDTHLSRKDIAVSKYSAVF